MNLPVFVDVPSASGGEHSQTANADPITAVGTNRIEPAMPALYCAVHAAMCLGMTETLPVAGLCWANFAVRCSVLD